LNFVHDQQQSGFQEKKLLILRNIGQCFFIYAACEFLALFHVYLSKDYNIYDVTLL